MFGDDANPALWERAAEMEAKRAPQRKAKAKAKAKVPPPQPPPPPPPPSPPPPPAPKPKAKAKAKAKKAPAKKAKAPLPVERDELVMAEPVYAEEPPLPLSVAEQTNQSLGRRLNDVRGGGLTIKKADFTVNSLMDKIRRGKLDLRPSYQREYVWDNRTASKLIESLLLNVPIPTLFFHEVRVRTLLSVGPGGAGAPSTSAVGRAPPLLSSAKSSRGSSFCHSLPLGPLPGVQAGDPLWRLTHADDDCAGAQRGAGGGGRQAAPDVRVVVHPGGVP